MRLISLMWCFHRLAKGAASMAVSPGLVAVRIRAVRTPAKTEVLSSA